MRIPHIYDLPDLAQRAEWARLLECDMTTLYRAEKSGDLKGSKPTGRAVVYTKKAILAWLGLELVELEIPQGLQPKNTPRAKRQLITK
jgi:hypothetical protein